MGDHETVDLHTKGVLGILREMGMMVVTKGYAKGFIPPIFEGCC